MEGGFSFRAATWYAEKSSWEIQLWASKSFVLSLPQILWCKMEKVLLQQGWNE